MKDISLYNIRFDNLKIGLHNFSFEITDDFFSKIEENEEDIYGANVHLDIQLLKEANSLELYFVLDGQLLVVCDRCLDKYFQTIYYEDSIKVVFADKTNFDTDADYVELSKESIEINITQFIYEFLHFALPLSHYHPLDEKNKSTCNSDMMKVIDNYVVKDEYSIDPRWNKLAEINKLINI